MSLRSGEDDQPPAQPTQATHHYFMIDFGNCEFCAGFGTQRNWWKLNAFVDEEGANGYVMPKYLRQKGGFVYCRSEL